MCEGFRRIRNLHPSFFSYFSCRRGMMVALPTTCQFLQRDLPLEFRHSAGIVKSARGISPESCLKCTGETCTCTLTGKTCGELPTFCTHLENGYLLNSMEMATTMPCTTSRTTRLIKLYSHCMCCPGTLYRTGCICTQYLFSGKTTDSLSVHTL